MENADKRIQTRRKLKDALIELCNEKAYYNITILDICNRAQLYRSTFYRYYETKDDLLREIENEYIEDTRLITSSISGFHPEASPEQYEQYRRELIADMEYHRKHKKLCCFLLSPAGDMSFHNKMVDSVSGSLKKNHAQFGTQDRTSIDYTANFFANGFIATIQKWLKQDDRTAEEIADFFLQVMKRLYKQAI